MMRRKPGINIDTTRSEAPPTSSIPFSYKQILLKEIMKVLEMFKTYLELLDLHVLLHISVSYEYHFNYMMR